MGETVFHTIEPVFDERSRVLILGTMPSPKSRLAGFYYAHPQNRFWRVMFNLFDEEFSSDSAVRKELCLSHKVALWDVVESCEIIKAADSSIKNARPNDISRIITAAEIKAVFTTGKTAARLYQRLCLPNTGMPAVTLPSPSAANCAVSLERLTEEYRAILPFLA